MQKRNARKKGLQGYRTLKHSFCIHLNQENEYQIQYIKCMTIWWAYSFLSFISSCTDNLKTRKAAWKLIYDCMLLSYHVRVLEWIYTRQLPEYQGTHCWKSAPSLSVSNGIQNLVKWFIYELSGCWFESRYCHTINMKKKLRSAAGIILWSIELYFSVFSQKIWFCCHE